MAANPIGVIHDGVVTIPDDVRSDPRFQNGAKLQLVPLPAEMPSIFLRLEQLAGSWAHSSADPNALLDAERRRELADEAHWRD